MAGTDNLTPWKPGQSGNPKGRKKRTYGLLVDQLKKEGYEIPTKKQFIEVISNLVALDKERLEHIVDDDQQPMFIIHCAKMMINADDQLKVLQQYKQWIFSDEEETAGRPIIINFGNNPQNLESDEID